MIPTAWYPTVLASSPDGKYLAVSTLLGVGSGSQEKEPKGRYVHAYRGTVHVIPVPDEAQLRNYSLAVAENNRMSASVPAPPARRTAPVAIPSRPGEPSLIEHVVYIIKENRTYDQLFGDLEQGNGDPSLVLFGEGVADNHRKLAREFVLLDNFYASGGNSGDGHQWVTQANETSYALWPAYQGRSYPFDGTDPIAYSKAGFIWDAAVAKGKIGGGLRRIRPQAAGAGARKAEAARAVEAGREIQQRLESALGSSRVAAGPRSRFSHVLDEYPGRDPRRYFP